MIFVNPQTPINKNIPNIGLAYAATYFNVKVIDQNTMPYPKDRFLKYKTDVLGISVKSLNYSESLRIARLYKSKYKDANVKSISGFLDIQCCYPYLDFEDKITYDEPFSDAYPFPDYELFDSFKLFKNNWQKCKWNYTIMTSLGCPFQCIFCMSHNRKWRARSAENCYKEIKFAQKKWNIKSFEINDDCFNVDIDRVIKFCELVKPLNLSWICSNGLRADRFNEDMARAMSEAGCQFISFGVESADPEVLHTIKKGETIQQIEKAIDIAKKYFKGINGFFIIGLPNSSYEKDLYTLQWAKNKGINAHFSYYVPFDKTTQYDSIFYGKGSHPMSDVYPERLQKKIYKMTSAMRPLESKIDIIKRLFLKR